MSFRTRIRAALIGMSTLTVLTLGGLVRSEMTRRITAQYERRVDGLVGFVIRDLQDRSGAIATALSTLCDRVSSDNRFRSAALQGEPGARRYVLDYAGESMRLMQFSMLQVQDGDGRIISSGHFRNAFDRLEPGVPRGLSSMGPDDLAVVRARRPEGAFMALARVDSFRIAGRTFYVSGGIEIDAAFLGALSKDAAVRIDLDTGSVETAGPRKRRGVEREIGFVLVDPDAPAPARGRIVVSHELTELRELRRGVSLWIAVVLVAAIFLSSLASGLIASRISRPLTELSEKTRRVDLDHLDVEFDTSRDDEFGMLSRLLAAMTHRLRAGAAELKEAERRATLGELARQVNHDIKNGLMPVRNVFRHLSEVARRSPGELPDVFREREPTVTSGVEYLEALASNYARLAPVSRRTRCDAGAVVRRVVDDRQGRGGVHVEARIASPVFVSADPLSLRRVLENLADNAIESLPADGGRVTISARTTNGRTEIAVEDTGCGMTAAQQQRIFEDFFTTRTGGTGLGLSVVRRLVMDGDGVLRVDSVPGQGSRFVVEFPAPDDSSGAGRG